MARTLCCLLIACIVSVAGFAQDLTTPVPERLLVHSNILNEDRVMWVRMPAAARGKAERYAVLYITDGGANVNEIGSVIDFLADAGFMPPLIVVGITNTDRNRDLTPTRAGIKHSDGSVEQFPTTGGADKFLDFIQKELAPEVEKRYRTEPYRILAGHSLGGLFTVHALVARPDLFNAYIASSPSLWWDDARTVRDAQEFLPRQKELKKTLFFSLGNEGGDMKGPFEQLQQLLSAKRPKGFVAESARYEDEVHGSTELRTHYAGLRLIFAGWPMPRDEKDQRKGGLAGVEQHYRELSERFGFQVSAEQEINGLGYHLLGDKNIAEAMAAFERNVALYPRSANVYDSLADCLEAAGKPDLAMQNAQKAVEVAAQSGDPLLPAFKKHVERLAAGAKAKPAKE